MASLCLLALTLPRTLASSYSFSPSSSSATSTICYSRCFSSMSFPSPQQNLLSIRCRHRRPRTHLVRMAPDEEKLTRRNPLDFPIEWDRPKPGRRPDIFPQFSPMKTPLPPPLPYDPPEEDEEEEEKKDEEEEQEEEDPEKEEPEK